MPKLTCLCGESIDLSAIPNAYAFKLVPDVPLESLSEELEAAARQPPGKEPFAAAAYATLSHRSGILQLIECPACGRLAVFARASDDAPAFWFKREESAGAAESSLRELAMRLANES